VAQVVEPLLARMKLSSNFNIAKLKKKPKADIRKSVILGYNHSTWHIA
jgi:hypothetical protein